MKKIMDNLEQYILAVLMPLMCLIVFTNTIGRYSGFLSLPWAEEAARYLMIWIVFIGIALAAKKNAHFAVEVLFLITPQFIHRYARVFILLMVVFFNMTVFGLSLTFVKRLYSIGQVSPSLSIPMWMMYSAIPIGCFLMAVRSVQYFIGNFRATWSPESMADEFTCPDGPEADEKYK